MNIRMIKFVLVFVCMLVLSGCQNSHHYTPVLSSINIVDRNGFSETISNVDRLKQYENVNFLDEQAYQKVLRIYSRDAHGDIRAVITSYHPNGHPKQYLEVVNNRANGVYREWHENGKLKLETHIIGGMADIDTGAEKTWLFSGSSRAWDQKGNIVAEIQYKDGVLDGVSTYYHENGKIWKQEPCRNGKINGTYFIYLEDGQLLQSTEYANGLKHGPSKRYWRPDVVSSDENYCDGYLVSAKYFDICGEQISKIENGNGIRSVFSKNCLSEQHEYHQGMQDGEVKVFSNTGYLISKHTIKNGIKHGEEIEFYPPEQVGSKSVPMMSVPWSEGKIQGVVKTWYADGTQESQREMMKNKKNGLLSAWYPDGSLMLVEEYDQGKLMRGEYFTRGERVPITQVLAGKGIATLFDTKGNLLRKVTYNNGKPLID